MNQIFIFSWDFNTDYIEAGDAFTSVVVEAADEEEAWQLLFSHPKYDRYAIEDHNWFVKTADELLTGEPRVILLTYGMY